MTTRPQDRHYPPAQRIADSRRDDLYTSLFWLVVILGLVTWWGLSGGP